MAPLGAKVNAVANPKSTRLLVFSLLAVSIALLIPGLFAPVLTIRGVLTREGVAHMAPMMLERGLERRHRRARSSRS